MLYSICIGLILVACVLMILAVMVQSPKSGMAANFGASNQVMGVRQTSDFLEKFTWAMAGAILALSLLATVVMDGAATGTSGISSDADAMIQQLQQQQNMEIPQAASEAVEQVEAVVEEPAATEE
ncbi:MAG: preprotein translocase subunit SecG [Rikenellaceae bacterium]